MPPRSKKLLTAIPLLALIVMSAGLVALTPPQPASAGHLCGGTGSPFGPFDFQTYEDANYKTTYARTMELAGFNQLLPDRPSFALPAVEGVQGSPYIPPVLLKSIAWIESGWAQASYDPPVQYGQVGPVLASHDCGYGIMQVTSGMQNVSGVPNIDQAMIGGHYAFNIARGARILAEKWNAAPEYRPIVGTRNTHIIEDWYYALWGYNGFSSRNHPLSHDPNRPPYLCDGTQPRGNYPYQELVLGCVAHPPVRGGAPLWPAQGVALPNLADPAFAGGANGEAFNDCVYKLQCGKMNISTPDGWHVDPTTISFPREQVIGFPSIGLSTGNVSLVAPPGGQSPSHLIAIGNGGTGALAWRLTTTAPWLRTSRVQGVSLGADLGYQHQVFSLHADASSVLPGTHSAQILVESLYAAGTPAVITVTVETADGAIVSAPDGHVYVLVGGLRRYIPDGATFEGLRYKWSSIIAVPQAWLNAIPAGDSVPSTLADGRLISSSGFLYVMQSGAKRWVTGGDAMTSCGYGWDSIAQLSGATADRIPNGPPLYGWPCPQPSFPNGTLFSSSDGRLWVTMGQARRWITGGQALSECGYKWGNRNELGDSIMNALSVFPAVTGCTSDGSLLWQQSGGLHAVYGGLMRHIPNAATFDANGFDWSRITPLGAPILPAGDPLLDALATGRLVTAGSHVYVMDGGFKRWITSGELLSACGYRWEARGLVSAATLASIPELPPLQSPPCPQFTVPHGTLFAGSDGRVWATLGVARTWMTSVGAIADCGFHIGNTNPIPDSVLAGFPAIGGVNGCTSDGSLVTTGDGRVSVVRSWLRRWVPSGPTLEANALSWSALAPIADWRLAEGRSLPDVIATGRLISSPSFVYVMQSGFKRWVPSGDVMSACGYAWDAVTQLSNATETAIPELPPLSEPPCPTPSFVNGTLLQGSDGRIWAVQSGGRRWITGGAVFAACGYHPANVDRMADSIIAALPEGATLESPPCP